MPSTPINTVPQGLQSLLNSQSLGVNPNTLNQDIRPTVDLTPFLFGNKILSATTATTTGVNAKGTYAEIKVPPGSLWLVIAVESRATLSAGTGTPTLIFQPYLTSLGAGANFAISLAPPGSDFYFGFQAVADETRIATGVLPQPLALRSPAELATRVGGVQLATGGTWSISTTVLYYELNV